MMEARFKGRCYLLRGLKLLFRKLYLQPGI
jgi:hypothetical protein